MKTAAIKNLLRLQSAYGVDIHNTLQVNDIHFYNLNDVKNTYDLITINQVLHHVEDLQPILQQLTLLLNTHGYLLLKEHACDTTNDKLLIDLQHDLYKIDKQEYYPVFHYKTKQEWIDTITSFGLQYVNQYVEHHDPTKSFYALFKHTQ